MVIHKYIACDIEATTLNTVRGEGSIHCISFWNDEIQICYEWGERAIDFLAGLLAEGYVLVFHSAQYDVATLRHFTGFDIPPSQYRCTQILAHAINPQLKSYSLANLTGTKLDYADEMIKEGRFTRTSKTKDLTPSEMGELFAIPFNPVMERYNLGDVESTWNLWQSYQPHLEMDARLRVAYETIQNPFIDVVMSMHNGMYIDISAMYKLVKEVSADINKEYADFLAQYPQIPKIKWDKEGEQWMPTGGFTEPNLSSPNDVTSLLYMHGWQPKEFNRDTGRPLTDKATLQKMIAEEATPLPLRKVARWMLDIRSLVGIKTQCMTALEIIADNGKPWIYANWHQTGTKTGRLSSSNP